MSPLRTLGGSNRSRCGAVRILRAHSATPSALWVGRTALAVARRAFWDRKVKSLRTWCGLTRSGCGAVHVLRSQSEPSAHFGRVKLLSLWRGAHCRIRKRTFGTLSVGRAALDVARRTFQERRVNPLRTFGGSNRSRCGAVHYLRSQSEPSPHCGWIRSLSLWRGAYFDIAK